METPHTINVCQSEPGQVCMGKQNLSYEIIAGITVSLSLSSTCTVYCQLADRLSFSVFICTAWVGVVMTGFFFFSVVKREGG